MTSAPSLIGIDWGTSSLRGYLLAADGAVLARTESTDGILAAADKGFEAVLATAVAAWRTAGPPLPIVMSGMIGSRQGWVEVPYVDCPADAGCLAKGLHRHAVPSLGAVWIVPGLLLHGGASAGMPDVMRGEETQVLGALADGTASGTLVLPGTHSKWVQVADGRIERFATYMTGEVFAALCGHTILGRLMQGERIEDEGFARGVADAADGTGAAGALLNRIFAARTLALTDRLAPPHVAGYLSGLLIGSEIAAAHPTGGPIVVIGNATLTRLYRLAAARFGITAVEAPADCVAAGLLRLARAAGLLTPPA